MHKMAQFSLGLSFHILIIHHFFLYFYIMKVSYSNNKEIAHMKKLLALFFTSLFLVVFPQVSNAATIDEVKSIVKDYYVGTINGDLDDANTIDEVVDMLDPYSTYFTKNEFEEFLNYVDMKSVGIGVVIEKHEKGILVVDVIENGSASQSGITAGDIILSINGISAAPLSTEEASSYILGEENTAVSLSILKTDGTIQNYNLIRKPFSIPNVTSSLLYGNVGYINLSSFSEDGAQLVANAYNKLKQQGATSYILDLQNNGGGYVDTAIQLINMFPNVAKPAIHFEYAPGVEYEDYSYIRKNTLFPSNTKVLVNGYSASASEMTAVALLDQKAATLYGETTYGKGCMQTFFELEDGSYLKLTIAEFSGPKGTEVNNIGVTPTVQTTENPIYAAHFDSIAEKLSNYKKMASLANVPTTKTFTVNFNKTIQSTVSENTVELIELGSATTVDVTLQTKDKQLLITPVEPLQKGAEYMLIIRPTITDTDGKTLTKGSYLHVTVKK